MTECKIGDTLECTSIKGYGTCTYKVTKIGELGYDTIYCNTDGNEGRDFITFRMMKSFMSNSAGGWNIVHIPAHVPVKLPEELFRI